MKIKTLTLYKTKLDAEYNNVIDTGVDTYLNNTTYKTEVLDAYYNNIIFYNGDVKSGQENNGILTIRITKDYTELLNYNYVCINNGNKNYFYFITNMIGLNDSENPITEITLKRDAWSNNIEYFTNHQETDIQQILRSHFIRWYDDGNSMTFWPYYYNTDDRANITKFKNEQFLYTSAGNYVVWCWFRVSNDCKIGPPENAVPIKNAYFGKSYFDSAAPVYIFPVAILTGFTDGVPNFDFNFIFNGNSINMSTAGQLLKAFDFNSDKFIEAGLTIYPPFSYTCSGSTITASNVITTTASIINELNEVIYNPANDFAQICYVVVSYSSTAYTTINYEYTNTLTGFAVDGNVGAILFDPEANYRNVKYFEPRLYCAPFVDINFICSNLSIPIEIMQDRTKFKAIVNYGGKISPLVSCFLNDTLIASYNNLQASGNIPTSINKWESFLSKAVTNVGLNAISATLSGAISGGSMGAAMGAVGALGSGITSTVNNMVETASRPNTTSQPSEIASDNIPRYIPKIVKSMWVNEREIEGIAGELYTYGYRYRTTRSVKYNCRVWFDYCQTENCKLPDVTNLNDRAQLEQAFNRGLTKWHFDKDFGLNSDFERYQNNVERKYINAEDAQISFKFAEDKPYENKGTLSRDILMDNRTGTYSINENGLTLTTRTTAMIKSNTNLSNYITFGARLNSSTHQIKITEWASNNTYAENVIMCNVPYNSSTVNWYLYADASGALFIKILNAGGTYDLNANINDCIGKTLTLSYTWTGYATQTTLKFYVNDVETYSGTNLGQANSFNIITLGYPANYNAGYVIYRMRSYYYPNENKIWTVDEVKKHLL